MFDIVCKSRTKSEEGALKKLSLCYAQCNGQLMRPRPKTSDDEVAACRAKLGTKVHTINHAGWYAVLWIAHMGTHLLKQGKDHCDDEVFKKVVQDCEALDARLSDFDTRTQLMVNAGEVLLNDELAAFVSTIRTVFNNCSMTEILDSIKEEVDDELTVQLANEKAVGINMLSEDDVTRAYWFTEWLRTSLSNGNAKCGVEVW